MNIDVRLEPHKSQKYVLAYGKERIFLWGNSTATWHKHIVEEIPEQGLSVKGGGKVKVLTDQELIYVWGKSSRYGESPKEETIKILGNFFKGYRVIQMMPPEE